jgi:uncharacterized protein (TIGR00255 family)
MMKSMTGFGYAEHRGERIHASVELKSYNNRYLDININLPGYLSPLEPFVRGYLGERVSRGRVDVYIKLKDQDAPVDVTLDHQAVRAYREVLRQLAEEAGIPDQPEISDFLRLEGVISMDRETDIDRYTEVLEPILTEAYETFDANRREEGAATTRDIERLVGVLESGVEMVAGWSGELETRLREHVRGRFSEVVGDDYDEDRVYTEIASLLVRYSINEELSRLRSHLTGFRTAMEQDGAVGKKLDFIGQEINREVNTVGSKSFIAEVNGTVVEMKDAVENIREQLRNVE